jgi:hypothetical protein
MNELQYQDVSTYLRAWYWYKGKKNDSPIELGSDLGHSTLHRPKGTSISLRSDFRKK